jgi:hypothetical protein
MLNNDNYINQEIILPEDKKCKYDIVICELHNKYLHGETYESDSNISVNYLVVFKTNYKLYNINYINNNDINNDNINEMINEIVSVYKRKYNILKRNRKYNNYCKHSTIRNYKNIIERENYIKQEIAECIYLKGGELVAILKTFWIRIIQRVWKRIYIERKNILKKRMLYSSLYYRELRGKWINKLNYMPGLYGMLKSIKNNKK